METKYSISTSCNPVNILNLPNEILLRIFRFVPTYDLLKNLALVNNRFYELTKDNSVIESFDIENSNAKLSEAGLIAYLNEKKNTLKRLHLLNYQKYSLSFFNLLKWFENISEFGIGITPDDYYYELLICALIKISELPNLKSLYIGR